MNKINEVMHALGNHTWSEKLHYGGNLYRVCTVCKLIEYNDMGLTSPWWESQYNYPDGRANDSYTDLCEIFKTKLNIDIISDSLAIPQED